MVEADDRQQNNELTTPHPFEDAEEVLDRVTDAFFILNEDWEFTHVNAKAAKLLNRSTDELIGHDFCETFSVTSDNSFKNKYEEAFQTGSPVHFNEYCPVLEAQFEVHAYPFEKGLSVYFRAISNQKQYQEKLSTIHKTTRRLMGAETAQEIADIAVESIQSVLDFPAVGLYDWNDESGVLEPAVATDPFAERFNHDMPVLTGGESVMWDVFIEGEMQTYTNSQPPVENMYDPDPFIQRRVYIPLGNHGIIFAATKAEGEIADVSVEVLEVLAENVKAALERAKREQSLVEKEAQLQKANDQLTERNRINDIIRNIDQALINATRRSEIETAVCEKLADVEAYQLAWFGTHDSQTGEIAVQAAVGDHSTYLDQLLASEGNTSEVIPVKQAIQEGNAVFTGDILSDVSDVPWRQEALNEGYRSIASIPITFHENTYGVLEIYADTPNAFSSEEQSVLRELDRVIGNAINAIERKEALLANSHVELQLQIPRFNDIFSRFATEVDDQIMIESFLPRQDDNWLVYFTTAHPSEAVIETVRQYRSVRSIEQIRSADGKGLFGLVLSELPEIDFLAGQGATVTSIEADSENTEITLELPQSLNVRAFIQTCRTRFPDAELISRHQATDKDTSGTNVQVVDELTDQQQKALETALEGGFFAWPRDKTGEEIATSLGVSPPTFHRHIRVGLEKVVSTVLG